MRELNRSVGNKKMFKFINSFVLILLLQISAYATTITTPTIYATGDTVSATNLNNNFSATTNVVNGGLDNTNANTTGGFRFFETLSSLPSNGSQGRTVFNTSNNTLNFDNGSSWIGAVAPSGTLATGVIPYYNSGWILLTPGAQYLPLVSNGTTSLPSYQTLPTNGGGTGQDFSASSTGSLPYFSSTGGMSTLASGAQYLPLVSNGLTTAPSYQILPSNGGGTGANLGSSAQGTIPYFSSTGVMSSLAVGTSGKFLKTQGASANPVWAYPNSNLLLFAYDGVIEQSAGGYGETVGTTLNPSTPTGTYRFLIAGSTSYFQIWTTRWVKIPEVSTVTVWCRLWVRSATTTSANLKVDIGGQSNNVSGTQDQTTPEWKSFTIDVSSLTNGTVYDVTASLKAVTNANTVNCSNILGFGS